MAGHSGQRFLCACAALLLGCGPDLELPELRLPSGALPPARLTGVLLEGYTAGEREFEVHARSAEVDSTARLALLEGVRIRFRDPSRGPIEIRAERAELRLDSDDFVLRERVEGSTAGGARFFMAEVHYDQAGQRLWTDQGVRLERGGLEVEARVLDLDLETRRIRLSGGVRAHLEGS